MPNGGVPMHMVLRPQASPEVVIYCNAGQLRVYERTDWDTKHAAAQPIVELSEKEAGALAWFLQHWIAPSDFRPAYQNRDIDATFDY